jgi:predicted DNA-binding transcriptional regulator YafY
LGKVTAVLPAEVQQRVQRLRESMQVGGRQPGAGPVPLSKLQMALADARVVRLRYHGAQRDETTDREVEPLGLAFYLDQWHFIAWCRLRGDVRDFRVDRIRGVELTSEPTPPRPDFDLAGYLVESWMPNPRSKAEIEIHPRLLETVRRYWGTSVLEERAAGKNVQVAFSHAPEELSHVARWLLSFGTMVRVVGPETLCEEIVTQAREALVHHEAGR